MIRLEIKNLLWGAIPGIVLRWETAIEAWELSNKSFLGG